MVRNAGIDALRGVAIILVLGLHFFDLAHTVSASVYESGGYINRIFGHGYYGVCIFFVVSGYLITTTSARSIKENNLSMALRVFYIKRFSRIFPLLYAVILIGFTILQLQGAEGNSAYKYLFQTGSAGHGFGFWLSVLTFFYNWFEISWININHGWFGLQWAILWSLAVEEQFYILFPWFIKFVRKRSLIVAAVATTIFVAECIRFILIWQGYEPSVTFHNSLTCFDALGIGLLIGVSPSWNEKKSRLIFIVGLIMLSVSYLMPMYYLYGLPVLFVGLASGMLVQGLRAPGVSSLFGSIPALKHIGKVSYGMYLIHPMIFYAVYSANFRPSWSPWSGFLVSLLLTFCAAKLSYGFFEVPIEAMIRGQLISRWRIESRNKAVIR